ncbi:MAG: hypothetical protein IV107_04785, partial [Paucibacter sp.]|nr:hypothetical protein [Roseateles sp.]
METENRARLKRKSRNSTQRKRKNERSVIGREKLDLIRASLGVALAWGTLATKANANPSGGVAIVGQANMTTTGNHMLVTTQNGAGTNH